HKWRAIFYSALFFGLTHAILQQQIVACLVGVVIGMIAVQTGSVFPGILFHLIHNTLQLLAAQASEQITPRLIDRWPALGWLVSPSGDGMLYRWPVVALSGLAAFAILVWFGRLSYPKSSEEERYEALLRASESDD
ncbi:MAG: CPBP family intramembrane glutamic endopeptidase, partial [Planctomycetota bacterium]